MKAAGRFEGLYAEFCADLRLSRVGGLVFMIVAVLGVCGVVANLVIGGAHGDQLGAVSLIFLWIALAGVIAIDVAIRLLFAATRRLVRHAVKLMS
jgi:hypothetical protein